MTDINLFKQYELAWSEFIEWLKESEWYSFIYEMYCKNDPKYTPDKLLPMLLKVFAVYLKEKADIIASSEWSTLRGWRGYALKISDSCAAPVCRSDDETEALFSACIKGFEIRNNQLKDK